LVELQELLGEAADEIRFQIRILEWRNWRHYGLQTRM